MKISKACEQCGETITIDTDTSFFTEPPDRCDRCCAVDAVASALRGAIETRARNTPERVDIDYRPMTLAEALEYVGRYVAEALALHGFEGNKGNKANAALIAAAPELLEALENLVSCYDSIPTMEKYVSCVASARSIINRAKGN